MISKNRIKFIRSLALKKHRDETGFFIAEGPKTVNELLKYYPCEYLAATEGWECPVILPPSLAKDSVTDDELAKISFLKTPQYVLAVFRRQKKETDVLSIPRNRLCLALDNVQDPGNLGTIIRLADWFGIEHIFCSLDTADAFSPKTVQATMGAIARVHIHYLPLADFIASLKQEIPVYGTFLDGENIYSKQLEQRGLLVMGNEGNGISPEIEKLVNQKLYIPNYPDGRDTSESLNVAVATAVTCAEFRRRGRTDGA